jgi:hypothetical protein
LAVRGARLRLESRLPLIPYCLLPQLCPIGVMGQPLDLLGQAVGI